MRRWGRRFRREEHGAAIIEFALVAPLLLALVWGIVETGRAFYTVNALASAVRDGARYGATCDLGNPAVTLAGTACEATIKAMVTSAFQPLGPPLEQGQVTASVVGSNRIRVAAAYPYAPIAPVAGWTFTMSQAAQFRYERLP